MAWSYSPSTVHGALANASSPSRVAALPARLKQFRAPRQASRTLNVPAAAAAAAGGHGVCLPHASCCPPAQSCSPGFYHDSDQPSTSYGHTYSQGHRRLRGFKSMAQPRAWQHRSGLACTAVASAAAPALGAGVASASGSSAVMQGIAVVLGWGCLIGSCFRSVPQIAKIVKNNSAEGLSLTSNVAELLCYTVIVAYNLNQGYPFNTFGEVFACWLQDIVLVVLILRHLKAEPLAMAGAAVVFGGLCLWLFNGGCPLDVLAALQLSTIFVMALGSRLPQIILNIRRGNAGMMSLTTCILNVTGNSIRIFTTLVITKDPIILIGCITQGILNTTLLYQTFQTARMNRRQAFGSGLGEVPC